MATTNNRLAELAFKHLIHDLSETERYELNRILQEPGKQTLFEDLMDRPQMEAEVKKLEEADRHMPASWQQIKAAYHFHHKRVAWKPWLAAAAVLASLAIGVTWYYRQHQSPAPATAKVTPAPAKTQYASNEPRSEKALWKRAAGLVVSLDEMKNGVENSSGVPVTKNDSGLVYSPARRNDIPLPDTVQTLKGGYYRLQLPDGSKVVLNSASSVFFAPVFGNDRQVSVYGEAWFEVKKDPRPFYVHVSGMKIKVYGTRFNVQAYPGEDVKTLLVDGRVKVTAGKQQMFLKPGEQAVLTKKKKLEKVTDSSAIKKAIAWRNGTFMFENDNVRSILEQLGRRYNFEVEYNGDLPNKTFDGEFSRMAPVKQILDVITMRTGIRFAIEGKKITVQP